MHSASPDVECDLQRYRRSVAGVLDAVYERDATDIATAVELAPDFCSAGEMA